MTRGKQGAWTDVYALGGTIYRALTGKVAEDALNRVHGEALVPIKQLEPDVPDYVSAAVEKAMQLNELDRYTSVALFMQALKEPVNPVKDKFKITKNSFTENISGYIHSWSKTKPVLIGMSGIYAGQTFELDQDVILGRAPNLCNVVFPPDAAGVSKIHCQICLNVNGYRAIVDCDSTYGTFLNGVKLYPGKMAILQSGSEIRIGNREIFRFNL